MDYHGLAVTGRTATQAGYELKGMCYSDGYLFVGEALYVHPGSATRNSYTGNSYKYSLAVYRIETGHSDRDIILLTLLDRLELGTGRSWSSVYPRVNNHSRRVFVPCRDRGVVVAYLNGDTLVRERTLTCVRYAVSVDVMSLNTAYVGDSSSVCVVDVRNNRISSTLEMPDIVRGQPYSLAVLGDTVMVSYGFTYPTLVVYRHGSPAPVKVIQGYMSALSTDYQYHFLMTDCWTKSVYVMDTSGNLRHTVNMDYGPYDCTVVKRKLWVGYGTGEIDIMSSQ